MGIHGHGSCLAALDEKTRFAQLLRKFRPLRIFCGGEGAAELCWEELRLK
jgi:hypothetical protein